MGIARCTLNDHLVVGVFLRKGLVRFLVFVVCVKLIAIRVVALRVAIQNVTLVAGMIYFLFTLSLGYPVFTSARQTFLNGRCPPN